MLLTSRITAQLRLGENLALPHHDRALPSQALSQRESRAADTGSGLKSIPTFHDARRNQRNDGQIDGRNQQL